ncbi:MAG: trypsin-like peptidase domain-containing protein, partial [SAR324 cluster bacterium]|nr:trypsin-like peptidase domain-containing protein [SAR324 cluster bacterium]
MSKETIFCARHWKLPLLFLSLFCMVLFVWAFYLFKEDKIAQQYSFTPSVIQTALTSVKTNFRTLQNFPLTDVNAVVEVLGENSLTQQLAPLGSGAVVTDSGYVVTALNLVSSFKTIRIRYNGKVYDAHVIKTGATNNLALLKIISTDTFSFVTLKDFGLGSGENVFAFGKQGNIVASRGVITATGETLTINNQNYGNLIRTTALKSWEQNGGPLMNMEGYMVGLSFAIAGSSQQINGYAVPSKLVIADFQDMLT